MERFVCGTFAFFAMLLNFQELNCKGKAGRTMPLSPPLAQRVAHYATYATADAKPRRLALETACKLNSVQHKLACCVNKFKQHAERDERC